MKRWARVQNVFMGLLCFAVLAVACSPAPAAIAAVPTATAAPSVLRDGVYTQYVNNIEMTLQGGHFTMMISFGEAKPELLTAGSYNIDGNVVTFNEEQLGPLASCGKTGPYKYSWSVDEQTQKIMFTAVEDHCQPRRNAYLTTEWSYRPLGK